MTCSARPRRRAGERNPFAVLGLPARPDLTDEQVRAAWRAIAAATHPDRPDGGDPARYAAASAAYAVLRTAWGRSEAYADLTAQAPPAVPPACPRRPPRRRLRAVAWRWCPPGSVTAGRCAWSCGCWWRCCSAWSRCVPGRAARPLPGW